MAGATMNYWQLHIGDWAKSCAHLSPSETGFYIRFLNWYYDNEKPIPADDANALRLVCARTEQERSEAIAVLREFFVLECDGWHNRRADSEINKLRDIGEKRSKAAGKRWHKNSSADAMQLHTTSKALQDSKTPRLQEQEQVAPQPPAPPPAGKAKTVTLKTWLNQFSETDTIISTDDPIYDWAESVGLANDMLGLAWAAFIDRYENDPKKYIDWRAVFRRAVRENWLKLWYLRDGQYLLTTVGEQVRRAAA